MNIGVISSSNGSAFIAAYEILRKCNIDVQFLVLTDRACGIEDYAATNGIAHKRIIENDNNVFSQRAKEEFDAFGNVSFILLYYFRLVSRELIDYYTTINLHESLLPAFVGFNAIQRAHDKGVKYFGTTMHFVNENADDGPIIAQASYPVDQSKTVEDLSKVSFIHKVYMALLLFDYTSEQTGSTVDIVSCIANNQFPISDRFNPALRNNDLLQEVAMLDEVNNTDVLK